MLWAQQISPVVANFNEPNKSVKVKVRFINSGIGIFHCKSSGYTYVFDEFSPLLDIPVFDAKELTSTYEELVIDE